MENVAQTCVCVSAAFRNSGSGLFVYIVPDLAFLPALDRCQAIKYYPPFHCSACYMNYYTNPMTYTHHIALLAEGRCDRSRSRDSVSQTDGGTVCPVWMERHHVWTDGGTVCPRGITRTCVPNR